MNKPSHRPARPGSARRFTLLLSAGLATLVAAYGALLFKSAATTARGANLAGLVDHNGRALQARDLTDRYKLVFFGFTQCPTLCPMTLLKVQTVLRVLDASPAELAPLFVSIDPEHDGPAVLKSYVAAIDRRILGITGQPDRVDRYTRSYGVVVRRDPTQPAPLSIDHSVQLYLLAPDNSVVVAYQADEEAQRIAADIARRIRS